MLVKCLILQNEWLIQNYVPCSSLAVTMQRHASLLMSCIDRKCLISCSYDLFDQSYRVHIMPLVIHALGIGHMHTTHTF